MSKRRTILIAVLAAYALGLVLGQLRLPLAAIKSLADYDLLRDKPRLSATDDSLRMLPFQRWYLKRALNVVDGDEPPRISARVEWNWLVVARVHAGHYVSPTGAEGFDAIYVCVFGAWIVVYSHSHVMA